MRLLFVSFALALIVITIVRNPQIGGRMKLASKYVTNKCCQKKHCPVGWLCSKKQGKCVKVSVGTRLAKYSNGTMHTFCYNDKDCKPGHHCGYNSECVPKCKTNDDCKRVDGRMECVNMGQGRLECRYPCQSQRDCSFNLGKNISGVQICKKKKRTSKAKGHCIGVFPNIHRKGKHSQGCKNTGLLKSNGKHGAYFTHAKKCENGSKALFTKNCFYPLKVNSLMVQANLA